MKWKKIIAVFLILVTIVSSVQVIDSSAAKESVLKENDRQELNFNTNWLFIDADDDAAKQSDYDEANAEKVSLPHSLGEYDIFNPDLTQWQKITWYRRHFTIPEEEKGNRVIIYFDGGGQINNLYVNGAFVGTAKGTFTDFSFDITDYITFGEYDNVLAIEVDSTYHRDTLPPSNDDFHWMGGLHGDARMEIVDSLSMDSVFYWTEKIGTGIYQEGDAVYLKGEVQVTNLYSESYPVTVTTELFDKDGNSAGIGEKELELAPGETATAEMDIKVEHPQLWNTETPYLYNVFTTLKSDGTKLDTMKNRTGLRWITSTGKSAKNTALTAADDQQILLNDQPLKLYGINKNQQFVYIGNSSTEKMYEKDAYTLKYDLGVNFVRTAHYSQDPDFFDACDEIGILVEEEALGWNTMPAVARPQFVSSVMSMVKRDRNHPCIIFWSIMPNEGTEANYPVEERQEIQKQVKELDHTRLTIQEENNDAFTFVTDVYANHDYVVSTSAAPMKAIKRQPYVIGEWNDNLGRVFVSPYDSEGRKIRQVTDDGKKMAYFMQDETIDGIVKWDFNGYLTSLNNYKWGKTHGIYRISGVYGPFKDPMVRYWEADMMRVQTDSSIVGNVVEIMNEWKADSPKEVYVAANAPYAELWKESADGTRVSLGKIAPNYLTDLWQGLFRWENVSWEAGSKLIAVSYDTKGNKLAEDIRYASSYDVPADSKYILTNATKNEYDSEHYQTYGKAAVADNLNLQADGSDMAVLIGVLQDKNGQKLDYAYENTAFEIVSGPGKLITGPRVYMLGGVNSAYLQTEYGKTGETVVKASVDVGTMFNQDDAALTYSENGWTTAENTAYSYEGDYAKSTAQGAWVELKFTGTQAVLYSHLEFAGYGTGKVTVDGKAAGNINFKRGEDKVGNLDFLPIFETERLKYGEHIIRITADSSNSINVDAWKVFDGKADVVSNEIIIKTEAFTETEAACHTEFPKAPLKELISADEVRNLLTTAEQYDLTQYTAVDALKMTKAIRQTREALESAVPSQDTLREARTNLQNAMAGLQNVTTEILHTSTADNEGGTSGFYRYEQTAGTWVAGDSASGELYANKKRTAGDYVSLCFTGTGIRLYGKQDANHGIARIILTDANHQVLYDEKIDMYSAADTHSVLMFENLALEEGTYVIKIMVTGETSGNPNNACVGVSKAVVYRDGIGQETDRSSLKEKLAEAKRVESEKYKEEHLRQYWSLVEDAEYLLEHPLTTEKEISLGISRLEEAEKILKEVCYIYPDVKHDAWYEENVQFVHDRGYMSGNDGLFTPNGTINRQMTIVVLHRILGKPVVEGDQVFASLKDANKNSYYADALRWAFDAGIMKGKEIHDGKGTRIFDGKGDLTRQQFAVMLYEFAVSQGYETDTTADYSNMQNADQVSSYARKAMAWAVGNGIITGKEIKDADQNVIGLDLAPRASATRAQVAKMIQVFCEKMKE